MRVVDFTYFIRQAWAEYGGKKKIKSITDISAMVSTNHVYKVAFSSRSFVIAKLSYFGAYQHFVEDHSIINDLANKLPEPYTGMLADSLTKDKKLFTYRYQDETFDAWVVFYKAVKVRKQLPRVLTLDHIENLGRELAHFHKACTDVAPDLPTSSKTMKYDVYQLLAKLEMEEGSNGAPHAHKRNKRAVQNFFGKHR